MATSALGVGWSNLTQKRLQAITEELDRTQREDRKFVFLGRTPITPAVSDEDAIADFQGEVFAADIIMDDQEAVVTEYGQFTSEERRIANLKHGIDFTQKDLDEIESLASRDDAMGTFMNTWINRRIANLLLGTRSRLEWLIVSCYLDSTVYDRYGIKINGTWGTPSGLKFVADVAWNDHENATPVSDLEYMKYEAMVDAESPEPTVVDLSRKAFNHMIQCQEFIDRAKTVNITAINMDNVVDAGQMPNPNNPLSVRIAELVTGFTYNFYETGMTMKNADGSKTRTRNLPHNKIILSSPEVWNNAQAIDVGNAIVTESIVTELIGDAGIVGGMNGRQRGPVTYAAAGNLQLNPPTANMWNVMRCFPRKFMKEANGVIDIGINATTGE